MKEYLDRVRVGADLTSATVDTREITAPTPAGLRTLLAAALYDVLHAGRAERQGPVTRSLREPGFERELVERVPHRTSPLAATVVADLPGVVRIGGVRVRVPGGQTTGFAAVPAVKPALSPGFLMVDGSVGIGLERGARLRVYLGVTASAAAPGVWGAVVGRLEELGAPYRAKVLSSRAAYPRRDAVVVYLGERAWHVVPALVRTLEGVDGMRADVSAFTATLAPGVGVAWEPHDHRPGSRGLSFGEHRSRAIAEGLIAHAVTGGDRDQAVAQALRNAGVDPDAPHRNLTSPQLTF